MLPQPGTRKLTRREIRDEYPTKFCKLFEKTPEGENRFLQLFDTLFDTPKVSIGLKFLFNYLDFFELSAYE